MLGSRFSQILLRFTPQNFFYPRTKLYHYTVIFS